MSDVPENILEKIRKLKAMADRPAGNEEEAAVAAAKMQELLFQYNLSLDQVDAKIKKSEYIRTDSPLRDNWKRVLIGYIATNNFCTAVKTVKGQMAVIGKPHNVEIVMFLYDYLSKTIDRLAGEGWDEVKRDHPGFSMASFARRWKNSFRIGAVRTIKLRLEAQRKVDTSTTTGRELVLVTGHELMEATGQFFQKLHKQSVKPELVKSGYIAGREAGHDIPLSSALYGQKSNPTGAKALAS